MNNQEVLNQLMSLLGSALIIVASYGVAVLSKYLNTKKEALKQDAAVTERDYYLNKSIDIIDSAVKTTNQLMVDALKKRNEDGILTEEEAKEAYEETKNNVMNSLSEKAKEAIADVYGDIDSFLKLRIQSSVRDNKLADSTMSAQQNAITHVDGDPGDEMID